jgi:hypothetical protein
MTTVEAPSRCCSRLATARPTTPPPTTACVKSACRTAATLNDRLCPLLQCLSACVCRYSPRKVLLPPAIAVVAAAVAVHRPIRRLRTAAMAFRWKQASPVAAFRLTDQEPDSWQKKESRNKRNGRNWAKSNINPQTLSLSHTHTHTKMGGLTQEEQSPDQNGFLTVHPNQKGNNPPPRFPPSSRRFFFPPPTLAQQSHLPSPISHISFSCSPFVLFFSFRRRRQRQRQRRRRSCRRIEEEKTKKSAAGH